MAEESDLWAECRDYVIHAHNGKMKKVEPAGDNGFPDGLVLIPGGITIYAEFKAKKGTLKPRQKRWRSWLKESGFLYIKVDDFYEFCEFVKAHSMDWV